MSALPAGGPMRTISPAGAVAWVLVVAAVYVALTALAVVAVLLA